MNYLINYRKEFREHYRNEITINEEKVASALCIFSRPGMPIRRIGNFRIEFPPNDTDLLNLNQFIKQHKLHEKSINYIPQGYGSRLVSFSIRDNDKWIIHSLPTSERLSPPLDELETKLIEIMKRVAEHPLRSFYIEAKPDFYSVRPGDIVSIELIMNSSGQFPLKVYNPASISREGGCSLKFLVWSVNKLDADLESISITNIPMDIPNSKPCEICCSDYFLVKEYDNMPLQILFSIGAPYTKIYKVFFELASFIIIIKV